VFLQVKSGMTDFLQRSFSFRGHQYVVACQERYPQDPTWFSHEDESSVRDRDWDIQQGDVVVDIGAAYGSYTLAALACGASFSLCFNPNEEENENLLASLSLNGDWTERVQICPQGLWSRSGFLRDTDLSFAEEPGDGRFAVSAMDDLRLEIPHGRLWLKLDVEGAEVEVLKGAMGLIRNRRPRILVENHQFKDPSMEQRVRELLQGLSYRHVSTVPYHSVSHSLYAPE